VLFNTLDFGLFLVVVLALYHVLPFRAQNVLLLVASYFFYGIWDWRFAGLLLLSTTVDFFLSLALGNTEDARRRKLLLLGSIVVNLGILGFFKYFNFFIDSASALLLRLGLDVPDVTLRVILPVGVSFYTFQELSYTVDVYRRELSPARNFLDFALYVSFFPQLVAGPIERATSLLPQIQAPRPRVGWENVRSGLWLILLGTFKKVVVADSLAHLVDAVFDPAAKPVGMEVLLGAYGFAFQCYCDFSGYSDVARGSARLLGFELMKNFDLPFIATSLRDIWAKWHISLTTWLRDYLYIPLGGNRGGRWLHYRNLILTMTICGFWHGAAWTYVVFGFLHGVCLSIQHALRPWTERVLPKSGPASWLWKAGGFLFAFHLWCLLILVFRSKTVGQSWDMALTLFTDPRLGMVSAWRLPFLILIAPLVLLELWQAIRQDDEVVLRAAFPVRVLVYAVLMAGIVLLGEDHGQPFVYFQF